MKNLSLQDQLLKAGLTSNNKAKQVRAEKRKQTKQQQKNKTEFVNEAKQSSQENKGKQVEKDRQLNRQRDQEAEKKQIADQIIQLINLNKLPKDNNGEAYNFTDEKKVKSIYISEDIRNSIINGKLAIVKLRKTYEVVSVKVAEKIKQRDEHIVIVMFSDNPSSIEDDEYSAFEVPDDLIW
ncbi:MAG: DUF2058 domain-containing protein [Methylococcaceae bacterium]|nr:DUF2058 domain-containing protein [Methylococcaceae bacterium]